MEDDLALLAPISLLLVVFITSFFGAGVSAELLLRTIRIMGGYEGTDEAFARQARRIMRCLSALGFLITALLLLFYFLIR